MSYAVRNTIILLVTLFLFVGGAFSYIKFIQETKLEELDSAYTEKQKDYDAKKATSDAYPEMNETYQQAVAVIEGYDKTLFKKSEPDDVFDYLNVISNSSPSSKIFFDYTFVDSTARDQYGIIKSDIKGYSSYTNFINFINKLENSRLLNKIVNLSLVPPSGEELSDITFTFTLESYYERIPIQEGSSSTSDIKVNENISVYNPFYPLIQRSLPANEENLINVEQSRIIGITSSRIFIIDQNGNINSLRKGDKVYLGQLHTIDINTKTATFNLNKGGITELVTLEIER
ncbi:MAG: hypothetical protein WD059_09290 [Balneolaceae bacterium]